MKLTITLADIQAAQRVIAGQVLRTPSLFTAPLCTHGAKVCIKYENLQATGSFKERGAFNKLSNLDDAERKRGVVAMSAGNHAQAVAYHAKRLGIAATIVMPEPTPFVKIAATEAHGAHVVLFGGTIAEAEARAMQFVSDDDLVLVHPWTIEKSSRDRGRSASSCSRTIPNSMWW